MVDMKEFWALFHKLWGQAKVGEYNKKLWGEFHNMLIHRFSQRRNSGRRATDKGKAKE